MPEELFLSETICLKDTRKVARVNTVKYQWRVLQPLPGAERPSYAGLRVEVLERADGELLIRYQGETMDYQEGPPPASALWGADTGCSPDPELQPELQEVADSAVVTHLDETQLKRLVALESSVEEAAKRAGGKEKPVRHQLHRRPTPTQLALWEAVQQASQQGFSLRAIARNLGMAKNTAKKYAVADAPPTKKLSAKERAKAEALAASLMAHRLSRVTYSPFKKGDVIAGQQHNDIFWPTGVARR